MGAGPIIALMLIQQNQRRMEEDRRRRRREEEERRRRRERQRQEEEQRMIRHRKESPVEWNNEQWQKDRCVKAISMQPAVHVFATAVENAKPKVIQREEKKYDKKIFETGYQYESARKELERDIENLRQSGVLVEGATYILTRLSPAKSLIATPEQTTESFGDNFTIMNGQPITIDSSILSSTGYFEEKYQEMNPEETEKECTELKRRLNKYQRVGKYLGFLLKTRKYLDLKSQTEKIEEKQEQCELRKKEMESYSSLTKEQLETIKSYFKHLEKLTQISRRIRELFHEKASLRQDTSEVYELAIQEVLSAGEQEDVAREIHEYISKIFANDPETMKEAYELVKGEYPIHISKRFIIDLIIAELKGYSKEEPKQKIHS